GPRSAVRRQQGQTDAGVVRGAPRLPPDLVRASPRGAGLRPPDRPHDRLTARPHDRLTSGPHPPPARHARPAPRARRATAPARPARRRPPPATPPARPPSTPPARPPSVRPAPPARTPRPARPPGPARYCSGQGGTALTSATASGRRRIAVTLRSASLAGWPVW